MVLLVTPEALARSWREGQRCKIADEENGDLAPKDHIDPDRVPNRFRPWYLKALTPYGVALVVLLFVSVAIAQRLHQ